MCRTDETLPKGTRVRTTTPPTTIHHIPARHFPVGLQGTVVGYKKHGNTVLIKVAFDFCEGHHTEFANYYHGQLEVVNG